MSTHPFEKGQCLLLNAVLRAALFRPGQALRRRHIQQKRQIWPAVPVHPGGERLNLGKVEAAPPALVGPGGVGEAIAQNPGPGRQGRLDALLHVLRSGREHQ